MPILLEAMGDADQTSPTIRHSVDDQTRRSSRGRCLVKALGRHRGRKQKAEFAGRKQQTNCKADYVAYVLTRIEGPVIPALTELTRARETRRRNRKIIHGLDKTSKLKPSCRLHCPTTDFAGHPRGLPGSAQFRNDPRVEYPWYAGNKMEKQTPEKCAAQN